MKKSKVIAALAFAALLFVFTGCSGNSGNPAAEDEQGTNTNLDGQENNNDDSQDSGDEDENHDGENNNDDNQNGEDQGDDNQGDDNQDGENQGQTEIPDCPEYVFFGEWPQTYKDQAVTINENDTKDVGMFTYYKGSDGAWYARKEIWEKKGEYNYFKVEPLKWRIITTNYNHDSDGNTPAVALLHSDKILDWCTYYNDTMSSLVEREINGKTIYPSSYVHSRVRAYLNGLNYEVKLSNDGEQTTDSKYYEKGFLQTAFSDSEKDLILVTAVDNSERTLFDSREKGPYTSPYADGGYTYDKIFLMSEEEISSPEYGFLALGSEDESRVRKLTDFMLPTPSEGEEEYDRLRYYWLRSPYDNYADDLAYGVGYNGIAYVQGYVHSGSAGVAPVFCVSLDTLLAIAANNSGENNGSQEQGEEQEPQNGEGQEEEPLQSMTFGMFPQTIKADDVEIDRDQTKTINGTTLYKGSDDEWYVECEEDAWNDNYTYSDGSPAGRGKSSTKYFKMEPIEWYVLTQDYNGSGKKLLFAKKILNAMAYTMDYDSENNNTYKDSDVRKYLTEDFYNFAFTEEEKAAIATTTVDNSAASTCPNCDPSKWDNNWPEDGHNDFACEDTEDKIFLLSTYEVTTEAYGFAPLNKKCDKRKHLSTDYALAKGLYVRSKFAGNGGDSWLLRSLNTYLLGLNPYGDGDIIGNNPLDFPCEGVAPALCLE